MDRYEEALEKARTEYEKAREQGYTWLMDLLEGMFPDLQESKDEGVRKALISLIYENSHTYKSFAGIDLDSMIAHLEKQKDLDKMIVVSPEVWDTAIADAYENGKKDGEKQKELPTNEEMLRTLRVEYEKGVADTIAKYEQKEQKPAEWSEDWREEDIQTRFAFYTYKDDPSVLYLSNVFVEETSRNHGFGTRILRAAEKVAEAIGATTISLKVKQNSPVNAWYRKNGYGYVAFEDGYDWLEKNLEYMKPNKQEWSEEDKETFEKLRRLLVICRGEKKFIQEADYNKMDNLLKSLRPPQYCENCKLKRSVENWKPSREQMEHLKRCISHGMPYLPMPNQHVLESLYNDLKKLL